MLRKVFLVVFISVVGVVHAANLDLVRRSFHTAVLQPDSISSFHALAEKLPADIAIFEAYKAVAEALVAQTKWNPLEKLLHVKLFNEGIEAALSKEPDNLEIRFLRFCVQYHIPKWLGFSDNLIEDKDYIVANADGIKALNFDANFVKYISYFLNDTGLCSPSDINLIRSRLAMR